MALGIGSGLVFSSVNCGCNAAKIVWNNTQTGNSSFALSLNVFTGTKEVGDTIRVQCSLKASVPFDSDGNDPIGFVMWIASDVIGSKQVPFDGSTLTLDQTSDAQTSGYVTGTFTNIFTFTQSGSGDRPLANSYILLSDVTITVKDDEGNTKQIITPDFSECGSVSDIVLNVGNGTMSKFAGACN